LNLLLGNGSDFGVDVLAGFQFLLELDQQFNTVDDHLDQFNFGETDTVGVGDIEGSVSGSGIDTTGTTLLETEFSEETFESGVLGKLWDLDVDTSTDTGSEVGWAGQDVSEMFVPHVLLSGILHVLFDLVDTVTESSEDSVDVTSQFHGDKTKMIFLVDPYQEVIGVVVLDTTCVGPVTGHTRGKEQWGDWLVEEEMVIDQLVLLFFSHTVQWVVFSLEWTVQFVEGGKGDGFDLSTFGTSAEWGKADTTDASSGTDTGREDVFWVHVGTSLKVVWVQVGLVLVGLGVTVVTVRDDWVEKIGPDFVALFITSNATDGHDEGMSWVVDTGLDGHVEGVTSGCFDISKLGVHFLGQDLGHVVVVLGEVWVVILSGVGLLNTGHPFCYGYSQTI